MFCCVWICLVLALELFRGLRLLVSACGSFLPALGWAMALLSLCMLLGPLGAEGKLPKAEGSRLHQP